MWGGGRFGGAGACQGQWRQSPVRVQRRRRRRPGSATPAGAASQALPPGAPPAGRSGCRSRRRLRRRPCTGPRCPPGSSAAAASQGGSRARGARSWRPARPWAAGDERGRRGERGRLAWHAMQRRQGPGPAARQRWRARRPAGPAEAVVVAVLDEALLGLGVPRVHVGAEALLVAEAALEEAHAEAQVVARLQLLLEQLLRALPADGQVVVALRRGGVWEEAQGGRGCDGGSGCPWRCMPRVAAPRPRRLRTRHACLRPPPSLTSLQSRSASPRHCCSIWGSAR
jgi:hypothetical protein